MTVVIVRLGLRLVGIKSLKDKRKVIRSGIARARSMGHCSVSEVGDGGLWGNAEIGIAVVDRDPVSAGKSIDLCVHYFESLPEVAALHIERESVRF